MDAERRHAEESLKESEQKVIALINAADESIWLFGLNNRVLAANITAAGRLGMSVEEVTGKTSTDLFPRLVDETRRSRMDEVIHTGQPVRFVDERAGIIFDHTCYPVRDKDGNIAAIGFFSRDITERKRAEEALRLSEEKFALAFANNSAAIALTRLEDGLFLEVNDTWLAMNGFYSRDEVIGLSARELHIWPTTEATNHFVQALRKHGSLRGWEQEFFRKSGEIYVAQLSATVLSVSGERLILSTLVDITERKRAEEAVSEMNETLKMSNIQLAAAMREMEAFNYSVAHDLRSPLRGMDGLSLALLEDYGDKLGSEGNDYLRRIRAASQRMGRLIDDLLHLSSISRREMTREKVDLSTMAADIADELCCATPQRQPDIIIAQSLVADGDPRLLRVAIKNLLGNALKFTGNRPDPRIEFGYREDDGGKTFFVRDNGVGFDMAYSGKLFGAFQRLHAIDEFPGTGIGLATVQRIVQLHGGRTWAEGEVDKGATVYFTL